MALIKGRIAMISEHASPVALGGGEDTGGQNVYVDQIARAVAEMGFPVDVFTRKDSDELPEVIDWAPGVRVINLKAGPAHYIKKDPMWIYMPRFRDAFLTYARREGYSLIHGHFWMSGWVACQAKSLLGVPVVETFHALGKVKQMHQGSADTSPQDRISVELGILRQADRIIAECPNDLQDMVELYGADPGKIEVIPAAVNPRTYRPIPKAEARRRVGLRENEWVVVYVGRILPRKGIDNLVEGFALLARRTEIPVRLVIVGGETVEADPMATPEIGRLSDQATALGIRDRVHFAGKRPQEELKHYYSAADVAVTTPWYEPFGLTPLEAMACGTPVIGARVGGIKFTVVDGETGLLVPPRNPEALAERLAQLAGDPDGARRMGRQARARVEALFTWERVAEQVAGVYESMLRIPADRPGVGDLNVTAVPRRTQSRRSDGSAATGKVRP